jgi:hypothetical protein
MWLSSKTLSGRGAIVFERTAATIVEEWVMTKQQLRALRLLEGRSVSVAFNNGTRVDDCLLVSAGRDRVATLWLFANGQDVFVASSDVLDVWEPRTHRFRAA